MSTKFHIDNGCCIDIYPPTKLAEGLQFAKERNIRSICIKGNPHGVFDLDLSAFALFPEIEVVNICDDFKISNVGQADSFYDTQIRSLALHENFKFPLELHRFPHLTDLYVTETAKLKIRRLRETLLNIEMRKLSHDDLSIFRDTPKLKKLSLVSPKISSLNGLEGCADLEEIFLFLAPRLTDIRAINQLGNLKRLWFERCKNMTQSVLEQITSSSLKILHVRFSVEDLSFLKNFPNLEEFYFTDIKDGNLYPLLDTKIKCAGFSKKKHYTHRHDEMSKLLKEKQA